MAKTLRAELSLSFNSILFCLIIDFPRVVVTLLKMLKGFLFIISFDKQNKTKQKKTLVKLIKRQIKSKANLKNFPVCISARICFVPGIQKSFFVKAHFFLCMSFIQFFYSYKFSLFPFYIVQFAVFFST